MNLHLIIETNKKIILIVYLRDRDKIKNKLNFTKYTVAEKKSQILIKNE